MKPLRNLLVFSLTIFISISQASAQNDDSTGLPGDNFSLEGALELFKKAGSPEEFEKLLNAEDNHVNNLDLDGDGEIDYIRVIGKNDKDARIFILQVAVNEKENQDIAVIELEKTGTDAATIQIVGDEEIFGDEVIVVPGDGDGDSEAAEKNEEPKGPYYNDDPTGVVVNVWFWPSVRFVYAPAYVVWVSPWRWHHYPGWWRPWRPMRWAVYHPYRVRYRTGFAVVRTNRVIYAHRVYRPIRVTSVTVRNRHAVAHSNYRVTHSRTTVTGPRGNSVTKRTTTVQKRNGRVKASKTTVRRGRH